MDRQPDVNEKMRQILVDWLVEVHLNFKLSPETLFLTVRLLDRYLAVKTVKRSKLQLAGVTCMLLAAKFEEIYAPEARLLASIPAFSPDEFRKRSRLVHREDERNSAFGIHITCVSMPNIYNA